MANKQGQPTQQGGNDEDKKGNKENTGAEQQQGDHRNQGVQPGARRGQSTSGDQGGQGKQNSGRPGKGGS